jgi:hypothetical protein
MDVAVEIPELWPVVKRIQADSSALSKSVRSAAATARYGGVCHAWSPKGCIEPSLPGTFVCPVRGVFGAGRVTLLSRSRSFRNPSWVSVADKRSESVIGNRLLSLPLSLLSTFDWPTASPLWLLGHRRTHRGASPATSKELLKWRIHPITDRLKIRRKLVTFQVMRCHWYRSSEARNHEGHAECLAPRQYQNYG